MYSRSAKKIKRGYMFILKPVVQNIKKGFPGKISCGTDRLTFGREMDPPAPPLTAYDAHDQIPEINVFRSGNSSR